MSLIHSHYQNMEIDTEREHMREADELYAKFDRDGTGKLDLHAFWRFTQAPGWAQSSPALQLEALLSQAPAPEPPGALPRATGSPSDGPKIHPRAARCAPRGLQDTILNRIILKFWGPLFYGDLNSYGSADSSCRGCKLCTNASTMDA